MLGAGPAGWSAATFGPMRIVEQLVDEKAAATGFSGVVLLARGGETVMAAGYGLADRAHSVPVTLDTQFGTASVTKGFTALVVLRLIEDGVLRLDTAARPYPADEARDPARFAIGGEEPFDLGRSVERAGEQADIGHDISLR